MIWNERELTGQLVGRLALMVGEIDYASLQDFVMKNESAIQEREFSRFDINHPIYNKIETLFGLGHHPTYLWKLLNYLIFMLDPLYELSKEEIYEASEFIMNYP